MTDMTQSQRAAVAVEQASFYPKGRPKENYKVSNNTFNEIADISGVGRAIVAHAKAVWDAVEIERKKISRYQIIL